MPTPAIDLLPYLPEAVPLAVEWATQQEALILQMGIQLSPEQIKIARAVGVQSPEAVRVQLIPKVPEPSNPLLFQLAKEVGLITPDTAGVTFGYGIYIRQDCSGNMNLLAHELTHVAQHERLGGIPEFVEQYCQELATNGYDDAPLEVEARQRAKACA